MSIAIHCRRTLTIALYYRNVPIYNSFNLVFHKRILGSKNKFITFKIPDAGDPQACAMRKKE